MAASLSENQLGISWRDSAWVPVLNAENVLHYFCQRSNPFYDRTCNNEVVKMQRLDPAQLKHMSGVEYELIHGQDPILYVIRKQHRHSPTEVTYLAAYYVLAGTVYQAPDLGSVMNSRILSAVYNVQQTFEEALSYARYNPSKGYSWQFPGLSRPFHELYSPDHSKRAAITNIKDRQSNSLADLEMADDAENTRLKEKAVANKKEAETGSSLFQRQRIDVLLADFLNKFPPQVIQEKGVKREGDNESQPSTGVVDSKEDISNAKTTAPLKATDSSQSLENLEPAVIGSRVRLGAPSTVKPATPPFKKRKI